MRPIAAERNAVQEEITGRTMAGNRCYWALGKIIRSKALFWTVKKTIYTAVIRAVVAYGSETLVLMKEEESLVNVWEEKVLRKNFGPVKIGDR